MSEYNIQMNKYNALSDDYDQLYPKPMKHASTHAKDGSDPILPSSIGAYSKEETDTLLAKKADKDRVVNPNLLDNWYFANPVNQRGKTSYTGAGYGIDRWYMGSSSTGNATLLLGNDCIRIISAYIFRQRFENAKQLAGKTVTVSMMLEGVVTGTGQLGLVNQDGWVGNVVSLPLSVGEKTVISETVTIPENTTSLEVYYYGDVGTDYKVYGAKLELGDQQTLAHQDANGNWVLNEIPDYGEQLARCQRYYQNSYCGVPVGSSDATGYEYEIAQSAWYVFHSKVVFPTTMRTTPTIKLYSEKNGAVNNASEYSEGGIFVADKPVASIGYNAKGFQWGSSNGSFTVNNNERMHWEAIADL